MKNIKILIAVFLVLLASPAYGAEASLPVRVKLIRCVTQPERVIMCQENRMCCALAAPGKIAANPAAPPQKAAMEITTAGNDFPAGITLE